MVFVTGPLCSGKRHVRRGKLGGRQVYDVQDLAADAADLDRLADELADYDVVTAAEVGGGVVPIDPADACRAGGGGPSGLSAGRAGGLRCADVLRSADDSERRTSEMLIYLLRHGLTEYNAQKRYQGQRDIPLSPEGLAQLRRADIDPKVVYISTLQRTRQTAEVLFPDAAARARGRADRRCASAAFEGRNYIEMEHDPDYQAWVAANCESSCPDGERKDDFQ